MKGKYELLLSLKLLNYSIKELILYAKECSDCYKLLKDKLDYLCRFMIDEENLKLWTLWGNQEDIKINCKKLRETALKALCFIEKYQSISISKKETDISDYLKKLSTSVKKELEQCCIDNSSKVIFVGSGAFPVSALIIAKEIRAEVICIDIDIEALKYAERLVKSANLAHLVKFSNRRLDRLAYTKKATHIIIASLVEDKFKIIEESKDIISNNAKIILRYGNGLKSIFNCPLDFKLSSSCFKTRLNINNGLYDTIILEKVCNG